MARRRPANPIFARINDMYVAGGNNVEGFIKDAIAMMEREGQDEMPEYFALLWELANFYRGASELTLSAEVFSSSLQKMRDFHMEETEDYALMLNAYGDVLRMLGNYGEALDVFSRALKYAEKAEDEATQAGLLRGLTQSARGAGDLKKASEYAKRELKILREDLHDTNELASALAGAAAISHALRDYDVAEKQAMEALELYEDVPLSEARQGTALTTLASIRYIKGDLDGAAEAYSQAASLVESLFGRNEQYIAIAEDLAKIYEVQGDMKAAANHVKLAYKTAKGVYGADDERTRVLKVRLASFKAGRGR